jgi:hypothetical protein
VDHNPLEWPPPAVLDLSVETDDSNVMAHRLKELRGWLEENNRGNGKLTALRRLELPR